MPNPTLRDIVNTFTEEELNMTVPIDFQDVSAEDYQYVNNYNRLLAEQDYESAFTYRNEHAEILEKYIFDAKKMNYLQTLVINAYLFSKGEKSAANTSYDNNNSGSSATNVQNAIDECFQSVSDGKSLLASAITDKKVPTDANASFETMADNIKKIVLGSGNATTEDVLSGKTFTNADGVEYTGTMVNNGAKTTSLNYGDSYTIPAGYHNGNGKVTVNSLASQTSATATAADITKGYTAWVNGNLIIGTRTAPVGVLTGSETRHMFTGDEDEWSVTFSTPFDQVPTVTLTSDWSDMLEGPGIVSITRSGFVVREIYHNENEWHRYVNFTWRAEI